MSKLQFLRTSAIFFFSTEILSEEINITVHVTSAKRTMSTIVIEPVHPSRYEDVINYVYEEFYPREPLSLACRRGPREEVVDNWYRSWLSHGLSFAAIDSDTNMIVGIALNYIIRKDTYFDVNLDELSKPEQVIVKIIFHLENGINLFGKYGTDEAMEMCFIGVHRQYTGRGLARQLIEKSISIAKEKKFKFVQSNPDHPLTLRLLEDYGFETVGEATLVDFKLENGEPGFPNALPEDKIRLSVLNLEAK